MSDELYEENKSTDNDAVNVVHDIIHDSVRNHETIDFLSGNIPGMHCY